MPAGEKWVSNKGQILQIIIALTNLLKEQIAVVLATVLASGVAGVNAWRDLKNSEYLSGGAFLFYLLVFLVVLSIERLIRESRRALHDPTRALIQDKGSTPHGVARSSHVDLTTLQNELESARAEVKGLTEENQQQNRKPQMELFSTIPLLVIDDLGMRKLPATAAEDLLEIVMRRYERTSTLLTSNRPIDDWGKLLGDTAAVTAMLDRLLHHGHVLKCGPRSWRTKTQLPDDEKNEK